MTARSHTRRHILVWCALLGLTGLSYLVAQLDLGAWEAVIGLVIASNKVLLVALFFMHLIEERPVLIIVGLATVLWVALLCAGVAADVGMR